MEGEGFAGDAAPDLESRRASSWSRGACERHDGGIGIVRVEWFVGCCSASSHSDYLRAILRRPICKRHAATSSGNRANSRTPRDSCCGVPCEYMVTADDLMSRSEGHSGSPSASRRHQMAALIPGRRSQSFHCHFMSVPRIEFVSFTLAATRAASRSARRSSWRWHWAEGLTAPLCLGDRVRSRQPPAS